MGDPVMAEATYPLAVAADPDGVAALQAEVETLPGVEEALVDPDGLHVRFDADVVSDEEILATLQRAGYESPGEARA
jgi:copper chaperone CopZ